MEAVAVFVFHNFWFKISLFLGVKLALNISLFRMIWTININFTLT
jgi:hypothetical protein